MDPSEDNDNPTEQTSLLPSSPSSPFPSSPSPDPTTTPHQKPPSPSSSGLWPTLLTVASLALLFNMGLHIATAPSLAILQGIICKNYYEKGITDGVGLGGGLGGLDGLLLPPTNFEDDHRCKIGPVQSEVAEVSAWKDVFEILPAVALAIPWGILTDRIGRKKVLLLALFGLLLNEAWVRLVYWFSDIFPVRAVWFGGLFQAIGAGSTTFTSIAYVLVADVCPAEQRSTAFGYLLASTIVSRFIFVPIGGALISYDHPWLAMWLGFLVQVIGFIVAAFFVQETLLPPAHDSDPSSSSSSASSSPDQSAFVFTGEETDDGSSTSAETTTTTTTTKPKTLQQHVEHYLEKAKEAGNWTLQNPKIVLLLLCFWLYMMGEQAEMLLMIQYASKRLGWSFGKTSLLPSLGALTNLFTLTLLLPFLTIFFSHSSPYTWARMDEPRKDSLLAKVFATALTLGSLLIALPIPSFGFLASGEILYSAGAALSVPLRSLITNLVDARHRATLYTVISVCTYGATSVGRPVAAGLFSVGLKMGKDQKGDDGMGWMGLPFAVAGGMFAVVLGVVSFSGFGRGSAREGEGDGVDEEGLEEVEEERVEVEGGRYRD